LIASLWAQRQGAAAQKDPVTLSPPSLSFAAQTVGSTSAAQAVALTNNQATALNISSIAASGDFAIAPTGTCGASLASGKSCTINVVFAPIDAHGRGSPASISGRNAQSTGPSEEVRRSGAENSQGRLLLLEISTI